MGSTHIKVECSVDVVDESRAEFDSVDARVSEDCFGFDWNFASSASAVHDTNGGKHEKRLDCFRHRLSDPWVSDKESTR